MSSESSQPADNEMTLAEREAQRTEKRREALNTIRSECTFLLRKQEFTGDAKALQDVVIAAEERNPPTLTEVEERFEESFGEYLDESDYPKSDYPRLYKIRRTLEEAP